MQVWYVGPLAIEPSLHGLVVCMFLFTTTALVATFLRFHTRAFMIKRLGWDDWFMTSTMIFSLCFFVSVFYQIKYGLGKNEDPATIVPFLAAIYSTVAIYNFTQMLYKLSITFQAHRIFKTDPTRTIINFLIGWLVVCGIMTVCGALFYCSPVAKCWDESIPGHCGNRSAMVYSWAGFNLLNDIIILVLPIPYLVRLQLDQKSRVVLLSLFACGFFTTLISVIRLKALYDSMSRSINEQTLTGVNIALWSCIEINLAIITGSVPSLRPFVGRYLTSETYAGSEGMREMYGPGGPGHRATALHATRKSGPMCLIHDPDGTEYHTALAYPNHARLKIQVQQSIEMNSMQACSVYDDGDSSTKGFLVGSNNSNHNKNNSSNNNNGRLSGGSTDASGSPPHTGTDAFSSSVGQNVTRIQGGPRRNSKDTYSPV